MSVTVQNAAGTRDGRIFAKRRRGISGPRFDPLSIPDRWSDYSNLKTKVDTFPIIAFKVPLKREILSKNVPPHLHFGPDHLLNLVPNLGLVVDLTNTTRYYNPHSIRCKGVRHEKVVCSGQEVPDEETVRAFVAILDGYLQSNASAGRLVGVHCTHGVNTTGYLVCRYLIERCLVGPDSAIGLFEKARGHRIERENYLEDLRKRFLPVWDFHLLSMSHARGELEETQVRPCGSETWVFGRGNHNYGRGRGYHRGRGRQAMLPAAETRQTQFSPARSGSQGTDHPGSPNDDCQNGNVHAATGFLGFGNSNQFSSKQGFLGDQPDMNWPGTGPNHGVFTSNQGPPEASPNSTGSSADTDGSNGRGSNGFTFNQGVSTASNGFGVANGSVFGNPAIPSGFGVANGPVFGNPALLNGSGAFGGAGLLGEMPSTSGHGPSSGSHGTSFGIALPDIGPPQGGLGTKKGPFFCFQPGP